MIALSMYLVREVFIYTLLQLGRFPEKDNLSGKRATIPDLTVAKRRDLGFTFPSYQTMIGMGLLL